MPEPREPLDLEKLRSIGHLSRGRTMSRVREGRERPDSGEPFKAVKDELGNVVTEHGKRGSGLSGARRPSTAHALAYGRR